MIYKNTAADGNGLAAAHGDEILRRNSMIWKGQILGNAEQYVHDVGGLSSAGARDAHRREVILRIAAIAMIEKLRDALEATR